MRILRWLIAWLAILVAPVLAKTGIVVLPPDYPAGKEVLIQQFAEAITSSAPGDRILVYAARPLTLLATIGIPTDPKINAARARPMLAAQFAPVKEYLSKLPERTNGEPPGNVTLPAVLDEVGRNIIPSLPEKRADVLLIGTMIYYDRRDARWPMTERFYPSDGLLKSSPTEVPYGIAGAQSRLAGATLHVCWPNASAEFASAEHEQLVRRFWTLWTVGQSGRIGTITSDVPTCWRRFLAGETSGQTAYIAAANSKPEMLRARARARTGGSSRLNGSAG
jgi:hypothetical protein